MQNVNFAKDTSGQKSMSSFKKELASVLINGLTGKVHGPPEQDPQTATETDGELYQDTSTLQIVHLPWTNGPVLTELMSPSATAQSTILSLKDCVQQSDNEARQNIPELNSLGKNHPEKEDNLKLSDDCISSSDDDADHTQTEVQYSKLQTAVEQRKGFLSKFTFGRRKSVPDFFAIEGHKKKDLSSDTILEDPGKSTNFSEEKENNTNQKRGILAIGGHLRRSLFKRRGGRTGEKNRESPLQQIRPDDDVDTDCEDEKVLVFEPALQALDNKPANKEVLAEEPTVTFLPNERILRISSKKLSVSQHEIDSKSSKWYFKSAEELSRVTSSNLTHTSKTSLHSVPDEAYIEEQKSTSMMIDDGKAYSKQNTRKTKRTVTSIFSKSEEKAEEASIEAQQVLEVLRQVEGLDKQKISSSEDDDGGLRQYFEEVLPSMSDEPKKTHALTGALHWLRRGGKKKPDSKPDVLVELVSVSRTSDVGVQFPEPDEQGAQKDPYSQQPLETQDTDLPLRSACRSTAVSQELLWKVPEEQPIRQPAKAGRASTGLVLRCPSVREEFPVVHASHPAIVDYVSGDSLLTLSSLDVNDQRLEVPPTTPVQYSTNLKPPKIPIFGTCCPASNNSIEFSVPYKSAKENSAGKQKTKCKSDMIDDSKLNDNCRTSTKKGADAKQNPALTKNADNAPKQRKVAKKIKGLKETASPAVAIVKTVAKHGFRIIFRRLTTEHLNSQNEQMEPLPKAA
ncbi:hypothetical protein BIW11_05564 [Tropilaelaps mercedesae]|uniref:Uncharacterized protein n=1 Tax=Tropilaelaps mercedesae TaxID=418985 RepID=A0A1V9Y1P1_9ACAR|nr:hypothetical protein BIW11_05564 [Tropilaelaps mercedesae]